MPDPISILYLEDNPDDAFLIERTLRRGGYTFSIHRVEDGPAFEKALREKQWDLILSDYNLPDYSGMAAIELVRSLEIDTPFILLSGAIGEETATDLMRKGAADYIMKDNLSRLAPAIDREIQEASYRRKSRETDLAMQAMVKSIVGTTGDECFEKILSGLCGWMGIGSGLIGVLEDGDLTVVSCRINNNREDGLQVDLCGSPCQEVIDSGFRLFPDNMITRFPEDENLRRLGIESYVGIPLRDAASGVIGVLCIFSRQKIKPPSRIREYMEIVAAKASAEIERQQEEKVRKALEIKLRQSHKLEAIGTLAGGIAHDFNNILFPILGHAEMLLEEVSEEDASWKSLHQIYTSAMRARDLVRQILTFSRQETSESALVRLQPIINEVCKLIRATIPASIEIRQELERECGPVNADPTQIHQVLMNLTTNAYHAMDNRGGTMTIRLREVQHCGEVRFDLGAAAGACACITVADTGDGIHRDMIEKIFDPFYTTKEKGKGTGMGLSVVHGIVSRLGGTIQVHSTPGRGSEFSVYLPIVAAAAPIETFKQREALERGNEHILLVDDEQSIATVQRQMLERLGYRVTTRTGSLEALDIFRECPRDFDLVISDMAMPGMTGDRLAGELLKIRSGIPILLCSGYSEALSEKRANAIGIRGFLLKPVVIKDLAAKVREVLSANGEHQQQ